MCGMIYACMLLMCHPLTLLLFCRLLATFFNLSVNQMSLHPLLVIVMTEKFMNIIYFPFKWNNFLLAVADLR